MQPAAKPRWSAQLGLAASAGIFFFIIIAKLGDPVILDYKVVPPQGWAEILYDSWPAKWGYILLAMFFLSALPAIDWKRPKLKWPLLLPLVWLGWQFISATQSVGPDLTAATVKHFCACVVLFYLGYYTLGGIKNPVPLWCGLGLVLFWIVRSGFEQHFGGLEATRRMFYQMPNWTNAPPDLVKRVASNRIYATFVYPNALAGCLLLLLPVTLAFAWSMTGKIVMRTRLFLVGMLGLCALAALYWSGSKTGWLLMMGVGMVVLGHSRLPWKRYLIVGVLILGAAGFAIRFAQFFEHGFTSVVARFDYWKAAVQSFEAKPVFGTGPGTFSIPYQALKDPKAEMARLCHNDYLEQATDSGFLGFISYTGFILWVLIYLYRYNSSKNGEITPIRLAVWLGVAALSSHSLVEFHLYIPALAWTTFFLLGWLCGSREE